MESILTEPCPVGQSELPGSSEASYWLYRLAAVFSRHSSVMHWQALAVMHRMHRMHCPPPAAKQGRKQKKWNEPTIHSSSSSHFPSLLSPILLSQRSAAWQGPALPAKLNGPDNNRARETAARDREIRQDSSNQRTFRGNGSTHPRHSAFLRPLLIGQSDHRAADLTTSPAKTSSASGFFFISSLKASTALPHPARLEGDIKPSFKVDVHQNSIIT